MKKIVFAAVLSVVTLALALPAFADEAKPKAEKPKQHELTGVIKAVDATKGTVTVTKESKKGEVDKDFTVTDTTKIVTADKAVAALADLKVGEKVKVSFTEEAGKITVTKIAQVEKPKAKAAEKK